MRIDTYIIYALGCRLLQQLAIQKSTLAGKSCSFFYKRYYSAFVESQNKCESNWGYQCTKKAQKGKKSDPITSSLDHKHICNLHHPRVTAVAPSAIYTMSHCYQSRFSKSISLKGIHHYLSIDNT
jgi:hypothetical protein